jgi:cytochrome bd-type quinol oxidase subunit 1
MIRDLALYSVHIFFVHNFIGLSFVKYVLRKFRLDDKPLQYFVLSALCLSIATGFWLKFSMNADYLEFLKQFKHLKTQTYCFILLELCLICLIQITQRNFYLLLFFVSVASTFYINQINSYSPFEHNRATFFKMVHLILASIITACATTISHLSTLHTRVNFRNTFKLMGLLGFFSCLMILFTGHFQIREIARTQPQQFAAMEGIWKVEDQNKFIIFAKINTKLRKNEFEISLPCLGFLAKTPICTISSSQRKIKQKFYALRAMVALNFLLMFFFWRIGFCNVNYNNYKLLLLLPGLISFTGLVLSQKPQFKHHAKLV